VALEKLPVETFANAPRTPDSIKPVLRGVWFDPSELVIDDPEGGGRIDVEQAVLGAHSILYFVNKDDPRGASPADQRDPQFSLWEYPVSLWKARILGAQEASSDN
jgi:hypothetical protein